MTPYALTIFLGAFLLFQVQPLIGKYILPWFGGGPGVWTTCLLFFQVVLLGGYAYAHGTTRFLKPRAQAGLHLLLLVAALACLPITPSETWKPTGSEQPTVQILLLLAGCLGLPYFVLSSTGPLLQQWFSRTHPGVSPYRLYALSNTGSLLALVSYPFYFESHFTRQTQSRFWAWGLGGYALCCGLCAVKLWKTWPAATVATDEAPAPEPAVAAPTRGQKLLWLLLPACASVLLLATTNKLCQDVAVIPFLWVLPLALYLLSFIICFDSPRWYRRTPYALALAGGLGAICWALFEGADASLRAQVIIYPAGLFACCMVCHGELYRLRPDPRHLTSFYLLIAAGGALGGGFVALGAPVLFTDYFELHWGLLLCVVLFLAACLRGPAGEETGPWRWLAGGLTGLAFFGLDRAIIWLGAHYPGKSAHLLLALRLGMWGVLALVLLFWIRSGRFRKFRFWKPLAVAWLAVGLAVLAGVLWQNARTSNKEVVARSRNFYGILAVGEYNKDDPEGRYYRLQHGRITHGFQFTAPDRETIVTSYYGRGSGVACALSALADRPRRLGVIGLGTGTMAAHGRAGDTVRFYEINPQVQQLARSTFTYLNRSSARIEVALGDARLSLEREPSQQFDLLVLDAFSSDAIPVHLLTKEALAVYGRHMQPGGVIAVHISNRHLNLEPVVLNLARAFRYQSAIIEYEEGWDEEDESESPWWFYASTWVLLTHDAKLLSAPVVRDATRPAGTNAVSIPLWTDDFASLFQILQ